MGVPEERRGGGDHPTHRYTASEIYEPDWSLSPFPTTVVGTYSCHGIEPSYFTESAMAKINQDRGIVVQPSACRRPPKRRGATR